MKLLYFFDDKIKRYMLKGKKYCNPTETGNYECGISCIRQNDVNLWFYTKNGVTIAIDAGHLNFKEVEKSFKKIDINPKEIRHLFITHADVDHCGGIDVCGTNIFPNAKVYLGKEEKAYLNGTTHRMIKLGVKLKNCVQVAFTQYPDMNKKSLLKLKKLSLKIQPEYVCTGHSGMRAFSEKIFAHMNESAQFSRKRPFDNKAPYDICN